MIIQINVRPGSSEEKILKNDDGSYSIWIREKAEGNKANKKVINILAKRFGVHFRKIKIKNLRGRSKIVEIVE